MRGNKRRLWLEIVRPETERPYLSYQLFALRRSHDGPYDDQRDVMTADGFYDNERIRFQGDGLHAAYNLLYPRDRKVITKQILDITGLVGLTALWIDNGRILPSRGGQIKGNFEEETYPLIRNALRDHGIGAHVMHVHGTIKAVTMKPPVMLEFARLIRPYAHYSAKAKLQLRKSPPGSGQTRSQPTDRESNALLRRVG
jgi:hypothetical protein